MRAVFFIATYLVLLNAARAQEVNCSLVTTAMEDATKIRGLGMLKEVPCKLKSKAEVEQYLRSKLEKKETKDRLAHEAVVYKILGLIPNDFDYVDGVVKLYTEQIGGFYDPEKDYYAMAAWMPLAMQMPIAVHELTHALQDQHFDLTTLTDEKKNNGDTLLAHSALIEGDATAVMLDYARSLSGQPSIAKDASISGFMVQNLTGALLGSSLTSAPPSLQRVMIFPYVSGLHFVHHLLRKNGYRAVDEVFKRPPRTTEEILHPEKYLKGTKDYEDIDDPKLNGAAAALTSVYSDQLGEFVIATLLSNFLPPLDASDAASGWGGDGLAVYENKDSKAVILVWHSKWDTQKDTDEFFTALTNAYEKRFSVKADGSPEAVTISTNEFGKFLITKNERDVTLHMAGDTH